MEKYCRTHANDAKQLRKYRIHLKCIWENCLKWLTRAVTESNSLQAERNTFSCIKLRVLWRCDWDGIVKMWLSCPKRSIWVTVWTPKPLNWRSNYLKLPRKKLRVDETLQHFTHYKWSRWRQIRYPESTPIQCLAKVLTCSRKNHSTQKKEQERKD